MSFQQSTLYKNALQLAKLLGHETLSEPAYSRLKEKWEQTVISHAFLSELDVSQALTVDQLIEQLEKNKLAFFQGGMRVVDSDGKPITTFAMGSWQDQVVLVLNPLTEEQLEHIMSAAPGLPEDEVQRLRETLSLSVPVSLTHLPYLG